MLKVLGIESSCDETACGIVDAAFNVHANVVSSQMATHARFGGVVPEVAARAHLDVIDQCVAEALDQAGLSLEDIDGISVSRGPGLIGALLVGVSYAKGLAWGLNYPLIPVNHVHAHVFGARLGLDVPAEDLFPCLALVVSGGHTNLYYMESPLSFRLIGHSVDDACGECFDKVAKLIGQGYPGGPIIESIAREGDPSAIAMPKMMATKKKIAFSYSGLKTHMANLVEKHDENWLRDSLSDLCASFQEEALGQLVRKLSAGKAAFPQSRSVLIAGGVAANLRLRALCDEHLDVPVHYPGLKYCSDNGAMIAAMGVATLAASGPTSAIEDWDAFSGYPFAESMGRA